MFDSLSLSRVIYVNLCVINGQVRGNECRQLNLRVGSFRYTIHSAVFEYFLKWWIDIIIHYVFY